MEIKITQLAAEDMFQFSHSAAEGGQNAGENTWRAAMEGPKLLNTPEEFAQARDFLWATGGWDNGECAAFTEDGLNALILQFIAGDIREAGADCLEDIDWQEYEADENINHNIFKNGDEYFYYLGE